MSLLKRIQRHWTLLSTEEATSMARADGEAWCAEHSRLEQATIRGRHPSVVAALVSVNGGATSSKPVTYL